ncbi:MAG: winged helix-turn-helix domain-containing protein [Oscillospiraceae bacterium]|nr:winged helix-turn-helix domain-containing protein [Oscillospiraceae bacterium]
MDSSFSRNRKALLSIEGESDISENNRRILTENGYNVITAGTLTAARERLSRDLRIEGIVLHDVFITRIGKMLEKAERVPERIIRGKLCIDLFSGQAFSDGNDLLLTKKEFFLLLLFAQNEGKAISAKYIYEKVWNSQANVNISTIKVAVSNLRKKINGSGYTLVAEYGVGYRFVQV